MLFQALIRSEKKHTGIYWSCAIHRWMLIQSHSEFVREHVHMAHHHYMQMMEHLIMRCTAKSYGQIETNLSSYTTQSNMNTCTYMWITAFESYSSGWMSHLIGRKLFYKRALIPIKFETGDLGVLLHSGRIEAAFFFQSMQYKILVPIQG